MARKSVVMIWALLLVNIVKYPFFQFGPRYAIATEKDIIKILLLHGYEEVEFEEPILKTDEKSAKTIISEDTSARINDTKVFKYLFGALASASRKHN